MWVVLYELYVFASTSCANRCWAKLCTRERWQWWWNSSCTVTKSVRQRLSASDRYPIHTSSVMDVASASVINESTQISFQGSTWQKSTLIRCCNSNMWVMVTMSSVDHAEKAPELDFVTITDALKHINHARNFTLFLLSDLVLHKRHL